MMKLTEPSEITKLVAGYVQKAQRRLNSFNTALEGERGVGQAICFYGEGAMQSEQELYLVRELQERIESPLDLVEFENFLCAHRVRLCKSLLYGEEWRPNSTSLLHNAANLTAVRAKQNYLRLLNEVLYEYDEVAS